MKTTIAISGINAIDNPGPGTGIARSLRESDLDLRIIGFAYDSMEPGIFMDWLIDKSYIMPYPSGSTESYLNRLAYIHSKENIDIFISALDVELPVLIKSQSYLDSIGIKTLLPSQKAFMARDKSRLKEVADALELEFPDSINMTSLDNLYEAINKFGFPMMIKGPFYEAAMVRNQTDAEKSFYDLAAKWGYPVIAQKVITGEEYNLIGLGSKEGNSLGYLAAKKIMITKQGKVWSNVSITNQEIFNAAEKFFERYKWSGGFELELIKENSTGKFYLIEINPRFPAWIYLSAGSGINLAERMVKHLLNIEFDNTQSYSSGKILIRFTEEIIRNIDKLGEISIYGETQNKGDTK